MVGYWDTGMRNVLANDAYIQWYGTSPDQMTGLHIKEVLGDELFAENLPYIEAALAGEAQMFDRDVTDASGVLRFSQAQYIPDLDEAGHVIGLFVLVVDVSERVIAERELAGAHAEMALRARTDSLTGLASRAFFEERLEQVLETQAQTWQTIAVLMIDLDDFKPVNDEHGHAVGDAVLVQIAARLSLAVHDSALVARFGGDEFVVLCPEVDGSDKASALAKRLVQVIGADLLVPGVDQPIRVGVSIGVVVAEARTPGVDMSVGTLMREVDRRMYQAKRMGGDRWHDVPVPGQS